MTLPSRRPVCLALAAIFLLLAGGCSPKTRPARFYLLQPMAPSKARSGTAADGLAAVVGVGPVEIPAYLDRPQIVTGGAGAQLELDEFARWAEPLRDNFTHVLAEDLSLLMPSSHVLAFPWNRSIVPDYQVEVQLMRFHVDAAGNSEFKANWSIFRQNNPVLMKEFSARTPVAGGGYEARVAAQSRGVAAFAGEIAGALESLPRR